MKTKLITALVAVAAIVTVPSAAHAAQLPDPGSAGCHGRSIAYGLGVARDAGSHGLASTVGSGGIDTVADLQQIIADHCDGTV